MPDAAYVVLTVFVIGLFFWLWMLVDCIHHEPGEWDKTLWLCIIVLLNVFGAALYLVLRYRVNRSNMLPPGSGDKPA